MMTEEDSKHFQSALVNCIENFKDQANDEDVSNMLLAFCIRAMDFRGISKQNFISLCSIGWDANKKCNK